MSTPTVLTDIEDDDDAKRNQGGSPELPKFPHIKWEDSYSGGAISPNELRNLTSASMLQLGGTISSVSEYLTDIKQTLSSSDSLISETISQSNIALLQQNNKIIENRLMKIEHEVSDLQSTKDTIAKVDRFLADTTNMLMGLISANGRLDAIQSEFDSIKSRLGSLESIRDRKNANIRSNISIVIAVIALIVTVALKVFLPAF